MIGQININSQAGRWLYDLSNQSNIFNIVEIGTWNEMGSTKCIYDAIKGTDKKLISLEINSEMYNLAFDFYKDKKEVELLFGKITDELIDLKKLDQSFFEDYSFNVKNSWRDQDLINLSKCENVLHLLPKKIDLLVLDGGEFSSLSEFNILKDRSSIIFLDDSKEPTIKNFLVRRELLKTSKLIFEDLNDRNGFSIFKYENSNPNNII